MPFFAANNTISTDPIEGGIKITENEYMQALLALASGAGRIVVKGGKMVIASMDRVVVYNIETREPVEIYADDAVPDGHTLLLPVAGGTWDGKAWTVPQDVLIQREIVALEGQQTLRRIREAALGIDSGWLKNLNDQIAILRNQLTRSLNNEL